jgi:hypothetical protein
MLGAFALATVGLTIGLIVVRTGTGIPDLPAGMADAPILWIGTLCLAIAGWYSAWSVSTLYRGCRADLATPPSRAEIDTLRLATSAVLLHAERTGWWLCGAWAAQGLALIHVLSPWPHAAWAILVLWGLYVASLRAIAQRGLSVTGTVFLEHALALTATPTLTDAIPTTPRGAAMRAWLGTHAHVLGARWPLVLRAGWEGRLAMRAPLATWTSVADLVQSTTVAEHPTAGPNDPLAHATARWLYDVAGTQAQLTRRHASSLFRRSHLAGSPPQTSSAHPEAG